MSTNFRLSELSGQILKLFEDSRIAMSGSANKSIRRRSKDIPSALTSENEKLNVVFAGAYSAGKSTLLSLLTGIKLKTGGGIVTSSTTTLDWQGINVVDTPGIHTELHPDHDAMTYEALSHADLVVFVMTSKGFNPHLAAHFQKLANERCKGPEMMLVINKMDEPGFTPEKCSLVFNKNFAEALVPFTKEGLYTSFLSTKRWSSAEATMDYVKKEEYLKRSGKDEFIKNLNRFVSDKGLASKLTTNLFVLDQILTEVLSAYRSEDDCADGMREMLTRQRNILVDSRNNVLDQSRLIASREKNKVQAWGNEISNSLTSSSSQKEIEGMVKDRMNRVDDLYANAVKDLEVVVAQEDKKIAAQFQKLVNSQFGRQVFDMVETRIGQLKANPEFMRKVEGGAGKLSQFGKTLAEMAKGPKAVGGWKNFFKIGQASQSQMHKMVLEVGHFFGHKFKPWEAVRVAGRIGQGAKVLGAVGAVVGIVAQIWSDNQEQKQEEALLETRNDVRGIFNQAGDAIEMEFDEKTQEWVEAKYGTAIDEIDTQIGNIEKATLAKNKEFENLKNLQTRCRKLIKDIQVEALCAD